MNCPRVDAATSRSTDPFDALLDLGANRYSERASTLRDRLNELESLGKVGIRVYRESSNDFLMPQGA